MWLAVLSDQLPITALVGHYPTNKLIGRRLPPRRSEDLSPVALLNNGTHAELPHVSAGYPPPRDRFPTCSSPVRHVSTRRHPVRLACIRHAASVDPEPGSNSPPSCATPPEGPVASSVRLCVDSRSSQCPDASLRKDHRPNHQAALSGSPAGEHPQHLGEPRPIHPVFRAQTPSVPCTLLITPPLRGETCERALARLPFLSAAVRSNSNCQCLEARQRLIAVRG
jgi:hypothetical protein